MSTNNQKQLKLIDDNEDYPESIKQTAKAGVTAAKLLYNGLRSHKIRHKKPDLLKWSQEFISFFKEQEPEAIAVLLDLLRWYCNNMAFKFVPQAYCPKTFIKKVERIAAIKAKIEQLQQKKNHKPSKTAKFAAELLFKTLKEHNLVVCKPDLEDWAREFSWFFNKHGDEFAKRVIRLLKWYSNNISDQWTPKAYNAEEFISKIKRIEDAMTRKEATQKAADDDSVFREHPYYQPPSKSNYYSKVPTNDSKDREGQKAINLPPDLDVKQLWLNGRL